MLSAAALLSLHVTAAAQLLFVQIWFRHGARAPLNPAWNFPSEPPSLGASLPYEPGELTKEGKMNEYTMGQKFRAAYADFLPKEYHSHDIIVYCDDGNRTSTSAQLVLAGLFPPPANQVWNPSLPWNPVAIHIENNLETADVQLVDKCPLLRQKVEQNPAYSQIWNDVDRSMFDFLETVTATKIPNIDNLVNVADSYFTRYTMHDSRLPVPGWLTEKMARKLKAFGSDATGKVFDLPEFRDSVGAWHLTRVVAEFEFVLSQTATRRKLALFSAHDTNVFMFGFALRIPEIMEIMCDFGGNLAFELHKINDELVVKFFYANSNTANRTEVISKLCGEHCTLKKLQELAHKNWVDNGAMEHLCKGPKKSVPEYLRQIKTDNGDELFYAVALLVLVIVVLALKISQLRKQLRMQELKDRKVKRPLLE